MTLDTASGLGPLGIILIPAIRTLVKNNDSIPNTNCELLAIVNRMSDKKTRVLPGMFTSGVLSTDTIKRRDFTVKIL
jgi:hypothetical protein